MEKCLVRVRAPFNLYIHKFRVRSWFIYLLLHWVCTFDATQWFISYNNSSSTSSFHHIVCPVMSIQYSYVFFTTNLFYWQTEGLLWFLLDLLGGNRKSFSIVAYFFFFFWCRFLSLSKSTSVWFFSMICSIHLSAIIIFSQMILFTDNSNSSIPHCHGKDR